MLLQHIVEVLDSELDRLLRLRDIVSGLAGPSILELREARALPVNQAQMQEAELQITPPTAPKAAGKVTPKRASSQRRSESPAKKLKPVEARALNASIPATPVVVSAAARAKEMERSAKKGSQKSQETAPKPGTLGSMIRALHLEANL